MSKANMSNVVGMPKLSTDFIRQNEILSSLNLFSFKLWLYRLASLRPAVRSVDVNRSILDNQSHLADQMPQHRLRLNIAS